MIKLNWLFDNCTCHHKLQYLPISSAALFMKKILQYMSKCNTAFYSNTTMSCETSYTFCAKNSTVFTKIQLK